MTVDTPLFKINKEALGESRQQRCW